MKTKRILFLNTETTGLPGKNIKNITEDNINKWPNLVTLHYKIGTYDNENKKIIIDKSNYLLIKPDKYKISEEAVNIHHITTKYATENGIEIKDVLSTLFDDIKLNKIKIIIGHNISFDLNILNAEFIRNKIEYNFEKFKIIDIMTFHHKFDYLKLDDLHIKLFDRQFKKSHPRKSNINIIIKCFDYLYTCHVEKIKRKDFDE